MHKTKDSPNDSSKFRPKSVQSGIKLSIAAKHFLSLLQELDRYVVHLSATPAINNAIRRYETIWLPLAANYGLVGPPIDVHWVWCVHMLSPVSYKQDCLSFTNKLIDHRCLPLKELQKARETSRKAWITRNPEEPFDFDPNCSANLDLLSYSSRLSQNLRESISKHLQFHYQVSLPHYHDPRFLEDAVSRYKKFVFVQLQHPDRVLVPLIDVVLIWHSHKLHPSVYSKDTKSSIDKVLLKNSVQPDLLWIQQQQINSSVMGISTSSSGVSLPTPLEITAELWMLVFKEKYRKPGTQYRGRSVCGKLAYVGLPESYLMSTKSAQVQIKSVLIDPHSKLDKYTIQLTNPLVAFQPFSNYMAKLKSPEKFWPYKPGQKFITNTSLVTGTVDSFNLEVVDRRGLFCANNSILASKKICLVDYIENFLGMESQTIDLQFDLGKEKETDLGRINVTLILYPPERHTTRLKVMVGENAVLKVPLSETGFWGWVGISSSDLMSSSISSDLGVECYFFSHNIINHVRKEVLNVRVIHSLALEKSIVQVVYKNQIVAISETIGCEQLPSPTSTQNNEMLVLDPSRGERAVLIKDNEGDWGLLIGRWDSAGGGNIGGSIPGVHQNRNAGMSNGSSVRTAIHFENDEYYRFSIRCYWLRGEWKVQYSHIPDSMNSWSVVLNDVSFDLSTGEIHISRQCNEIAQSVCLAFSCAVCLALCKPYNAEPPFHLSNSLEVKPPSDTFNTSLFLSPNTEIISIPPLRDYLLKKKDSNHLTSTFEEPNRLLMCIAVGINCNEYLPTLRNIKMRRTINKASSTLDSAHSNNVMISGGGGGGSGNSSNVPVHDTSTNKYSVSGAATSATTATSVISAGATNSNSSNNISSNVLVTSDSHGSSHTNEIAAGSYTTISTATTATATATITTNTDHRTFSSSTLNNNNNNNNSCGGSDDTSKE